MNDDLLPDREFLAVNAYLDGEAAEDERALVESSPELLAEVDRLRSVRAALAETRDLTPPAGARDAALAAALALFDDLQTSPAGATAAASAADGGATVVRFERRRRQYRWVGGVAAATLVAVGGMALLTGETSDVGFVATEAPAATDAAGDAERSTGPADAAEDMSVLEAAPADAPTEADAVPMTDAPAATDAPVEEATPLGSEAPGGGDAPIALEPPTAGGKASAPAIDDVEALRTFLSDMDADDGATTAPDGPATTAPTATTADIGRCLGDDARFVADVISNGRPAAVVDDGEMVSVVDVATCDVLLSITR